MRSTACQTEPGAVRPCQTVSDSAARCQTVSDGVTTSSYHDTAYQTMKTVLTRRGLAELSIVAEIIVTN